MKIAGLLLIPLLLPAVSQADYYTGYLWYRAEPDFARIVITEEIIRGQRGVDGFTVKVKEHEKTGEFLTYDYYKPPREITKVGKMDGHEIKTVLFIRPPRGHGLGGALPTCSIRVFFDGELKVDCPMGYSHLHSLTVSKVVIHAQKQMAEVHSTRTYEPVFNFFQHDKSVIVFVGGKLFSKKTSLKGKPSK